MSKIVRIGLLLLIIVVAAVAFVSWCWKVRDTPESRKAARKETAAALKATPPEKVLEFLEKLYSEKSFHTWFVKKPGEKECPCRFWTLRLGWRTRVPYDYISQLTEDQFIRFAGNGSDRKPDEPRLRELMDFSGKLLSLCSTEAANSMRERRLDGLFLCNDFDGAIALLEKEGIPSRSPSWCTGTAAKLRAHKAMESNQYAEAVKQLQIFGEFMRSEEQKDFEECDPTTGILYSRDWVVARNLVRCANMTKKLGDEKKAAAFLAEAKKYFDSAKEKAKTDLKSLAALEAEIKSAGL